MVTPDNSAVPERAQRPSVVARQYAAGDSWVIAVRGELDCDSIPPLREALEEAASQHRTVVLDAGEVTFADSSALGVLLYAHQATDLRIAAAGDRLMRLLKVTAADTVLSLHPSVDEACRPRS
ncbi:STAS domain-containing protein [Streptomyces sp. NPDC050738]|uniref:STAS domain-containing protein n=1 Tax=Streptomyces sp. NPDC050738 TaxID=3154744 RepID=UPI003421C832